MDNSIPKVVSLGVWNCQHRIIATKYPPIDLFENVCPPELFHALFELEARTNPRVRATAGDPSPIKPEDIITGHGATNLMAPFCHRNASRFSNGSFGIYYAAKSMLTAIHETVFHKERFARHGHLESDRFQMRVLIGKINKDLHDIREGFDHLHQPNIDSYPISQTFGKQMMMQDSWGLVYRSVRDPEQAGACIAAMRPPAVSIPIQGPLLRYEWNGSDIDFVYKENEDDLLWRRNLNMNEGISD